MHRFFNVRHPFFADRWRRMATVAFAGGWTVVEVLSGNPGWSLLFGGITAYCIYKFFIVFDAKNYDPKDLD